MLYVKSLKCNFLYSEKLQNGNKDIQLAEPGFSPSFPISRHLFFVLEISCLCQFHTLFFCLFEFVIFFYLHHNNYTLIYFHVIPMFLLHNCY